MTLELAGIYAEKKIHAHPPIRQNRTWIEDHRLACDKLPLNKILAIDCGQLAALTNPHASDHVVGVVADMLTFLFVFDDLLGEDTWTEAEQRACYGTFLSLLRESKLPLNPSPLHYALLDLKKRTDVIYPHPQRLYEAFACYFDGCIEEAFFRRAMTTAGLDSYISWREKCIGLYPVLAMLEVDAPISDAEFASKRFQRARTLAALIISAINDIFSLRKEELQGETSNFVFVIKHTESVSEAEGVKRTLQLHDHFLDEFLTIKKEIDDGPCLMTQKYVSGLVDWMRGNYWWSKGCKRYR